MKPRLLIFHDINGPKQAFLKSYKDLLSAHFEIISYDLEKLGSIDQSKEKHPQYKTFGIRAVVKRILKQEEKISTPCYLLGFSVGATIAYDLVLQGLAFTYFLGLSGTRIRTYESIPIGNIELIYGEEDAFRPSEDWLKENSIHFKLLEKEGHQFYLDQNFIQRFAERLISATRTV